MEIYFAAIICASAYGRARHYLELMAMNISNTVSYIKIVDRDPNSV